MISLFISITKKIIFGDLVPQIIAGIVAGILLAFFCQKAGFCSEVGIVSEILGSLFVNALKAIAPILVFMLVTSSIANQNKNATTNMRTIIILYLLSTFMAALVAVLISFLFPSQLNFTEASTVASTPPSGIFEVLKGLLMHMVDNPVHALVTGNFIGIIVWSVALGIAFHHTSKSTKNVLTDLSHGVSRVVHFVIRLAPVGIFGLVASTLIESGFSVLADYLHLVFALLGCMFIVALIINPVIVYAMTHKNPYPLVFTCLKESGIAAFFTRSSAANIPVNLELCERLKLHKDMYSVSIPLGATINMAGASVTITVLTLAAAYTLNIHVDIPTALLLSVISSISACGVSGIAGGSLLLLPLSCSLFGISNDIAMQLVTIGFVISIIQDSVETALNSSSDVLFTAAADMRLHKK